MEGTQQLGSRKTQKMQKPEISGIEYQHGELQGYEVRNHLLEKWRRKSAYRGKTDVPLEIDLKIREKAKKTLKAAAFMKVMRWNRVKVEKTKCFIFTLRNSGYFDLRSIDGGRIGGAVSYKKLSLLERASGIIQEVKTPVPPTTKAVGIPGVI